MLNYIATQLVAFCIVFWENPSGSNSVGLINRTTKAGWENCSGWTTAGTW